MKSSIKFSKSQMAIIDSVFVILLIGVLLGYLKYANIFEQTPSYTFTLKSGLNSIYYSENYRDLIIGLNLSNPVNYSDWEQLNTTLQEMFNKNNYRLIILNENASLKKVIFDCKDENYDNIEQMEMIIFSNSNATQEDFKRIRLGICY